MCAALKDPDFDGDVDTLNIGKDCNCVKVQNRPGKCSCVKAYSKMTPDEQKDGYKRRILRPRLKATITVKLDSRLKPNEMRLLRLRLTAQIRMYAL